MSDGERSSVLPEAVADCLRIIQGAPRSIAPLSENEIHLFAYVACSLFVSRGQPAADWGYDFTLTSEGRPFSVEVDRALRAASRSGLVLADQRGFLTLQREAAASELALIESLEELRTRRTWAVTAVECALAMPIGSIRFAMMTAPGVEAAIELQQRKALMTEDEVARLRAEAIEINSAIGDTTDLLAPAVAWLSYAIEREQPAC